MFSFDFMWYEFMCLSKLDFFEYVTGHKLHLNNAFSITKLQSPLETLKVCVSKCAFIFLALAIVLKHIWHWEELDLFVFSWHFSCAINAFFLLNDLMQILHLKDLLNLTVQVLSTWFFSKDLNLNDLSQYSQVNYFWNSFICMEFTWLSRFSLVLYFLEQIVQEYFSLWTFRIWFLILLSLGNILLQNSQWNCRNEVSWTSFMCCFSNLNPSPQMFHNPERPMATIININWLLNAIILLI